MGEAFGPVAAGPDTLYWNPAGIVQSEGYEASYSHIEMARFFHHDHAAVLFPVGWIGGKAGVSATLFYQDSIALVSNSNQEVGSFAPHSEAFTFGYARALEIGEDYSARDREFYQQNWHHPQAYRPLDRGREPWTGSLLVGGAVKAVRQSLHDESATSAAADIGVLFRPAGLNQAALSFVLKNVGTPAKFVNEDEDLPASVDLGASYEWSWRERRLIAAFETAVPRHGDPFAKTGLEYSLPVGYDSIAAFRLGYRGLTAVDLGVLSGLTGGVGFTYRRVAFDFGFQTLGELGEVYRFSVSTGF